MLTLTELPSCSTNFRHADLDLPSCYGDPMNNLDSQSFVTLMKVVAVICIIAMVLAVWPGDNEE